MSIFKEDALKGEHALVTGATGGIGYETAKTLAQMGARVTITGRRENVLQELKEEIKKEVPNVDVFVYVADLANEDERDDLVKAAEETFGFISLLVNNAGISGGDVLETLTQEELERIMHLNYTVPILLTQKVYESMKENKNGAVVNVTSLSGLRGTYANTAYAGSKFALTGFTQSFAVEAIEHKVRANAVAPGFVETEMGKNSINNKAKRANNSYEDQYEIESKNLPSGRITQPEEVANTIAFLLTEGAENIVGETVKISGGSVKR